MVDYDARKVFAYLKATGFCASNPPYNAKEITHSRMPRRALAVLSGIARRGTAGTTAWMQEVG